MLLTLSARCLAPVIAPPRGTRPAIDLFDLPVIARDELGFHGVNLSTDLLTGRPRAELGKFRDRADKARCACLLLMEPRPQSLADGPDRDAAIDRLKRVVEAGAILGCSAVAVVAEGDDSEETFEATADALREVVERAERREMNVLVSPHGGLTAEPERLTELLKRVGGFRIGTYPDFEAAAGRDDPAQYLRRLTPYAAAVCASTRAFEPLAGASKSKRKGKAVRAGRRPSVDDEDADLDPAPAEDEAPREPEFRHSAYDLAPMLAAVRSVGYDGTLTVEYRGEGDPTLGVRQSRELIEYLLATAVEGNRR